MGCALIIPSKAISWPAFPGLTFPVECGMCWEWADFARKRRLKMNTFPRDFFWASVITLNTSILAIGAMIAALWSH